MRLHQRSRRRLPAVVVILLATLPPVLAWGPHARITSAARETMSPDNPLRLHLGDTLFASLDQLCMLGDWRRDVRPEFFPDDYILFPGSPQDRDHLVPEVRKTYEPFFRRALWALRHETPENGARWVGALLHYVSDTASPPHAASVRGPQHSPMEGWIDSKGISLPGYQPRLLGDSDETAVEGFLARMEEVIAYSKVRGEKLADLDPKAPRINRPEILECALEAARVTADTLHTLSERLGERAAPGAVLRGRVRPASGAHPEYLPNVATHIVIIGTDWATCADAAGNYEFRDLPPGTCRLSALRPGSPTSISAPVALSTGKASVHDISLTACEPPGNRVRNPDFSLRWVRANAPDGWRPLTLGYPERNPPEPGWQSENIAVTAGARYDVGAARKSGATARVVVRWRGHAMANFSVIEHALTNEGGEVVTAPPTAKYLQILLVGTAADPASIVERVWCIAHPADGRQVTNP